MIIGITGKSGSGKSFFAEMLAKDFSYLHVDIDKISHSIMQDKKTKNFLFLNFGDEIFENDQINRKKLGEIVFEDNKKLEFLNNFFKNQIEKNLDLILKKNNNVILDYALLCGLKQFENCQIKILLECDFETRYKRVAEREKITREYFVARENSLKNYKAKFDYTLVNPSVEDFNNLIKQISRYLWLEKPL